MANLSNLPQFQSADSLSFRAACNAAVEFPRRPIKRRVVIRISESSETSALIKRLLTELPEGILEDNLFADKLSKDSSWQTLVLELIMNEQRWGDLLNKCTSSDAPKKILEWFRSLYDKLYDPSRPATRAATTAAVTLSTLWFAHHSKPQLYNEITQPIRAIVTADKSSIPVSFAPSSNQTPLTVTFVPQATADIPIGLRLDAAATPLKIQFVPSGNSFTDLAKAAIQQLHENEAVLRATETDVRELASKPVLSTNLDSTNGSLDGISANLANGSKRLEDDLGSLSKTYNSDTQSQESRQNAMKGLLSRNCKFCRLVIIDKRYPQA